VRLAFAVVAVLFSSACTFAGDPLPVIELQADASMPPILEQPDAGGEYNGPHGVLDPTFGVAGVASDFRGSIAGLGITADDTIYVSGTYFSNGGHGMAVAHYSADGVIDPSFGPGGIVDVTREPFLTETADAVQLLLRDNNSVVAIGRAVLPAPDDFHGMAIIALDAEGNYDMEFGDAGRALRIVASSPRAAAVPVDGVLASDGTIAIAGFIPGEQPSPFIARFSLAGDLNGAVMYGSDTRIFSIAPQADGKLIVGGYTYVPDVSQDLLVMRTDSKGVIDPSFGDNGRFVLDLEFTDMVSDVAVQPDGKIVVIGNTLNEDAFPRAFIIRLLPDGRADPDFGDGGIFALDSEFGRLTVQQVVIAPDANILIGGEVRHNNFTRAMLMRYSAQGAIDSSFGYNGTLLLDALEPPTYLSRIAVDSQGRILAAGAAGDVVRFFLLRVLP
jgi:uncharacterized delta-60 repeat protein